MKRWKQGLLLALVLTFAAVASAQVQFGAFTGVVTDASDAVIPGAEVTVTNVGTGLSYTATTDASGRYRFNELPPGRYRLSATATGFKLAERTGLQLNAGTIQRIDFQMQVGERTEVITVEGGTPLIQTEDSRLTETVLGAQIQSLPMNGRNVYSLNQLAPGAVNAQGVMFENSDRGTTTVANGIRSNFSGYLINGVSNKGLSGGASTLPNPDIVEEFQQLTLNMSAQYGNSAGMVTNLVTKSGTNEFHGSAFWFVRNDIFDANEYFRNASGVEKSPVRFNQFGGALTGPIFKDKLFFTTSYQGARFNTQQPASVIQVETPEWRQAVAAALPNSTANLLYQNFVPSVAPIAGSAVTLTDYVTGGISGSGFTSFEEYMCPDNLDVTGLATLSPRAISLAQGFQSLFGVTAAESTSLAATCPFYSGGGPAVIAGSVSRLIPFQADSINVIGSQTQGNLYRGNEWSARADWVGRNDRIYGEWYWQKTTDKFGPTNTNSGPRGFSAPQEIFSPNMQLNWVHTFGPQFVNEAKAGYARNRNEIGATAPGVPWILFDDVSTGFGAYNGYPQFFTENIFTYSDMVSISKGKHNIKAGVEFRRNQENSEFNVARPSYYFFDPIFFALDTPYLMVAGVDPGFASGNPAELASSLRYWRNLEVGGFFQDDWKVHRNLTLNLGVRYDLYTRHRELHDRATTFIPGPQALTKAQDFFLEWISSANAPAGTAGCDTPALVARAQLAGVCGPGGFASTNALGGADHNNFGPRVGAAWDIFGKSKTVLRGGFGVSYEGTLYNPLSNSRWNLPFYSFNEADSFLIGDTQNVLYGPSTCAVSPCVPDPTATPTFSGAPTNPGQGVGAQAEGNLSGWDPSNPNLAFLTGIVFPRGIRDPYVLNWYFGIQQEIMPHTVLEVNYVSTRGYKLFRAEHANRRPGARLPEGTCAQVQGRQLCSLRDTNPGAAGVAGINPNGRLNPNYGTLRVWDNVSRSWYNAMQVSVRRNMSKGLMFTFNYTWSHSIDTGSDWHSGATSANGGAAGDGYSLDPTRPFLDRGNSTFDIRHRWVLNYVWDLPWMNDRKDWVGYILGGWQWNGVWSFQTGAHWTPFIALSSSQGGDFNLDGVGNDRPDAPNGNNLNANKCQWTNGFFSSACGSSFDSAFGGSNPFFGVPCAGCNGDLGRNTFVGPSSFQADMSLSKMIPIREQIKLQFRFEMFNSFNHVNFLLPDGTDNRTNRITSSRFGQSNGTLNPRQIQFGLRLSF